MSRKCSISNGIRVWLRIGASSLVLFIILAANARGAIFTVDSTGDASDLNTADGVCDSGGGVCTLRAAIQQGNALAGTDDVWFNLAGPGVWTISPASPLPNITDPLLIDGWTQGGPGYTGPPLIELDGTNAGSSTNGLTITTDNSLVRGLVINRFGAIGILLSGADANTISGCYIGTDALGTIDLGNSGIGVRFLQAANNLLGGSSAAERNIISGNAFEGVQLIGGSTTGNQIKGNFIGTDVTGTLALTNSHDGLEITTGPTGNFVGGSMAGEGNLISGNQDSGIAILAAANNTVRGNLIGTDVTGTLDIGNLGSGIVLGASQGSNTIGGIAPGEGNRIAFNLRGVHVSGSQSIQNSIRGNSIVSNDAAGIELGAFGPTPNDPGDPDTGSNQLQNFPVLTTASSGSTRITGTLNSTPDTVFSLDFYSNTVPDISNHGEGEIYLGSTSVTTDAAGDAAFVAVFAQDTPVGHFITATATDPDGNTSEFSAAVQVLEPTAASVTLGGRVVTATGQGVAQAAVQLTDQTGTMREVRANPFGYFEFSEVTVGALYIISIRHKYYSSIPQTVFVLDARDDIYLEVF